MKVFVVFFLPLLFLGCVSTPPPSAELESARSALSSAQNEQITRHAPVELRLARDALAAANELANNRKFEQAKAQAERSQAYSELAQVKSEAAIARATVAERTAEVEARKRAIDAASNVALPALPMRPSEPPSNEASEETR